MARRPHVSRGDLGVVYVADPVQQIIARVVLDDGPRLAEAVAAPARSETSAVGIALLDVDILSPPVPRSAIGGPSPRAGLTRVSPAAYARVMIHAFGGESWLADQIRFPARLYRTVRRVQLDPALWIEEIADEPWPTVDSEGRPRFSPPGWPTSAEPKAARDRKEEGWHVERRVIEPHSPQGRPDALDTAGELIMAVGSDGLEQDVTLGVLDETRNAFDAATAGALSPDAVQNLLLADAE